MRRRSDCSMTLLLSKKTGGRRECRAPYDVRPVFFPTAVDGLGIAFADTMFRLLANPTELMQKSPDMVRMIAPPNSLATTSATGRQVQRSVV